MRAFLTAVVAVALSTVMLMSEKAPSEDLKVFDSQTVTRIGVVVNNVGRTAKAFSDVFGVDVSPAVEMRPEGFPRNQGAHLRVAEAKFDNMIIEISQPMGGPSPWRDFLTTYGEGIHHVAFNVESVEANVQLLEANGGKRIIGDPGGKFAVVDLMSQIGINIVLKEGQEAPNYVSMRDPEATASGGLKTVARLGLLGPDTDTRRDVFNNIFGIAVPEAVDERGLSFPEGFNGDTNSGMRHIFVPFDNIWMNVIQPIGGESPWQDMVKNHQHYLFFAVDDVNGVVDSMTKLGGKRTLGEAGSVAAYMDMQEQLGLTVFLLPGGVLPE